MSDQARRNKFLQQLSQTPQFQAMQKRFNEAAKQHRANIKDKWDGNAEQQRKASMSRDDRAREAVEQMVPKIKEFNDFKSGRDTSESEARKKATELAETANRNK